MTSLASNRLAAEYRTFIVNRVLWLFGLSLAVVLSFLTDIASGPANIGILEVLSGLINPDFLDPLQRIIVWEVRLPYALMAIVVGAALGLAGAEMQTVLNNPLASPFTLGIGSAATLGASLAIVLDLSWFGISHDYLMPISAFLFACGASFLILLLARFFGANVQTVILFGIALMFGLNAVVGLFQYAADAEALQQIVFWTMGSLARADVSKATLVAVVVLLCFSWSLTQLWSLTTLRSGEEQALSLGIAVSRLRLVVLMRVSLLTASALAFVGEIGFIGLVAPHIARMILGEDHRFFLPGSLLSGALLMSLASILSRMMLEGVIMPVGIVTALVGIPFFIFLIIRRGREGGL